MPLSITHYKEELAIDMDINGATRLDSDLATDDQVLVAGQTYCQIKHAFAGFDKEADLSVKRWKYEVVMRVIHKLNGPERDWTEASMVTLQNFVGDDKWWRFDQQSPTTTRSPVIYDVPELEISEPEREGDVIFFEATALVRFNALSWT